MSEEHYEWVELVKNTVNHQLSEYLKKWDEKYNSFKFQNAVDNYYDFVFDEIFKYDDEDETLDEINERLANIIFEYPFEYKEE